MFTDLSTDLRYAVRAVLRERGFSLVAVLTLGLGIGVTTALFAVADGVLLRPLPWPEPDRVVRLEERRGGQRGRAPWTITNGSYNAWKESAATVDELAAWRSTGQSLIGAGDAERLQVTAASPALFTLLKAPPLIGRPFVAEDARPGSAATAILSYGLWQQRFGGNRGIIGTAIQLDDRRFEVIAVMPEGFAFPDRETRVWVPFEPLSLLSGDGRQMRVIVVEAIARLKPGVSAEQAAAEATARARAMPDIRQAALAVFGAMGEISVEAAPVQEVLTNEVRPAIIVLLAAVSLLLAVSAANVVSLQMARATARRQEAAIRTAIGAQTWRLARPWLAESAVIGLCAGMVGVGFAAALVQLLPAWLPADFPRLDDITIDGRSFAFAFVVTMAVSIVCGTLPSLFARSSDVIRDLSANGKAQSGLASRGAGARLQASLVVGQVAAACLLLIGGALLARSFSAMLAADRGFDPTNVLTARLTLPHDLPGSRRVELLEQLRERLGSIPNVRHVAFGNGLPLLGGGAPFGQNIPSPIDPSVTLHVAATWRVVSPSYLNALQFRVVEGRAFRGSDTEDSPQVMVVNRSFATQYLGPNPVGRRLQLGWSDRDWEVIGVVEDVRAGALTDPTGPEFLVSSQQTPADIAFDPVLLVRTEDEATNHVQTVKTLVRELDPSAALDSIMTMDDRVLRSLGRPRAYALVLGVLAAISLAISAVGVFGLLSYTTALRTSEIGVRVAIGADPRAIAGLVLRQAMIMIGAGLAIGVTLALLAVESLARFVYGVTTRDIMSFALAPLVLTMLGLAAAILPARRAARVDPVRALRAS